MSEVQYRLNDDNKDTCNPPSASNFWYKPEIAYISKEVVVPNLLALYPAQYFYVYIAGFWPNVAGWTVIILLAALLGLMRRYFSPQKTIRRYVSIIALAVLVVLVFALVGTRVYLQSQVDNDSRRVLWQVLNGKPIDDRRLFGSICLSSRGADETTNYICFFTSTDTPVESWRGTPTLNDNNTIIKTIDNLRSRKFIEADDGNFIIVASSLDSAMSPIQTQQIYRITPEGTEFFENFTLGSRSFLKSFIRQEEYGSIPKDASAPHTFTLKRIGNEGAEGSTEPQIPELSDAAKDILRLIAIINCNREPQPGCYLYLRGIETKSREIITYNNALVFPRAYPLDISVPDIQDVSTPELQEVSMPEAPPIEPRPLIYCGDGRGSLEKTMNELLKADALKVEEPLYGVEPAEFADDDFSPRPIWYTLTPQGRVIYDAINKAEKQLFEVHISERKLLHDPASSATLPHEPSSKPEDKYEWGFESTYATHTFHNGVLISSNSLLSLVSAPNEVVTQNTLPMITCELVPPDATLLPPIVE